MIDVVIGLKYCRYVVTTLVCIMLLLDTVGAATRPVTSPSTAGRRSSLETGALGALRALTGKMSAGSTINRCWDMESN